MVLRCCHKCRRYTLLEMIVVCVVVMLVVALAVPKLGGGSRRMALEQSLSQFREAFGETAMRARATGRPLSLVLKPEQGVFQVSSLENSLDKDWHPQALAPLTGQDGKASILPGVSSYPVPSGVEWLDLPEYGEEDEGIVFSFFPDGEATGPSLSWTMHGHTYLLVMDSVLGKATILEEANP